MSPKRRETTKATRRSLYAASQQLTTSAEKELGLQIPFDVYLQDPLVAQGDAKFGFADDFFVRWEPGIADGPTSARFAVVDYNGDTGRLAPPATWDAGEECFKDPDGVPLDRENVRALQFHQVNVWAVLQGALAFFEAGQGLGRPIPFGFDGNRLIVVPHAAYGRNAYYDRASKSLQFYYFDNEDGDRVYTCLSTDIIHHEFGHAVLDGIRPRLHESGLVESAAFHEAIGDLTAILIILRDNDFRDKLAEATGGELDGPNPLSAIAEQFGTAVRDQPYLRTACNEDKMSDVAGALGPHRVSQVLTGAMFDILVALSEHYRQERDRSVKQAFWDAIQRMQRMAVQPLDLLPPADVTFRDYALAVLRAEELANPTDPHGYIELMAGVFADREILTAADIEALDEPRYLYERLRTEIFHDIVDIARSPAAAYRILDDNREDLQIPARQDVVVADLYDARKLGRQGRRLPRQIILQYTWSEEVELAGAGFGEFDGERTTMTCGGTLVFDENGNIQSWARKPGTEGGTGPAWEAAIEEGQRRRDTMLSQLTRRIEAGHVGAALGSGKGLVGALVPPLAVHRAGGTLRFELSPHLSLAGEDEDHYQGGRRWEASS